MPYGFNMILGPAAITAYELENSKAVYPRIIVDGAFIQHCKDKQISLSECYLSQDNKDDDYYLDFWDYMFRGKTGPSNYLNGCIEFVKNELLEAKASGNAKLVGQLYWYVEYLERHL